MTYPALVGSRKQSVEDAERLFSSSLLKFMEKKDYKYEAQYIRAIRGWRQACDQRGLSELERCRYNYNLLKSYWKSGCLGIQGHMTSAYWRSTGLFKIPYNVMYIHMYM